MIHRESASEIDLSKNDVSYGIFPFCFPAVLILQLQV
jgi:hypothetical protein